MTTIETLSAELGVKAMQCVDLEAVKQGKPFFNDEEFELLASKLMTDFCKGLLDKASKMADLRFIDCGEHDQVEVNKESITNITLEI